MHRLGYCGAMTVLTDSDLDALDREVSAATASVEVDESRIAALQEHAAAEGARASEAARIREWVSARIGMSFEDAIAEAERELREATADAERARADTERATEKLRDLQGYIRVLTSKVKLAWEAHRRDEHDGGECGCADIDQDARASLAALTDPPAS